MTTAFTKHRKDWPSIRRQIMEQANECCEFCGLKKDTVGAYDRIWGWHDLDEVNKQTDTDEALRLYGEEVSDDDAGSTDGRFAMR